MRCFFSCMFCLILLLPGLWGSIAKHGRSTEKKPPQIELQAIQEPLFYKAWIDFIQERLTLSSPLVKAKDWIDLRVFSMSDHADVHVGKKGWIFRREGLPIFNSDDGDRHAAMRQILEELRTVSQLFEHTGKRFVFSILPDKATIFREYVGNLPPDPRGPGIYELFQEAVKKEPFEGFVSLEPLLQKAKTARTDIYATTGTWLAPAGAALVAQALLAELIDEPTATALLYTDVESSSLPALMSRYHALLDSVCSTSIPSLNRGENPAAYETVLMLVPESRMRAFQVDLDRLSAMLLANHRINRRSPVNLSSLTAGNRLSLDMEKDDLILKSLGSEARLIFPLLPGSNQRTLKILKLALTSRSTDTLTWEMRDPLLFRKTCLLRPGTTELYVPLPKHPGIQLEINPGGYAGLFRLSEATLLELDHPDAFEPVPAMPPEFAILEPAHLLIPPASGAAAAGQNVEPEKDPPLQVPAAPRSPPPPLSPPAQAAAEIGVARPSPSSVAERKHRDQMPAWAAPGPMSIEVTDFEDSRIFQRSGAFADVVVSGVFNGRPAGIEACVVRHDTGAAVLPWTVIDAAPAQGVFMGTLKNVPQGGWYRIRVRFSDRTEIGDSGRSRWAVGILVACIGQSNMKEWFSTGRDLKPHPVLCLHRGGRWRPGGLQGNGATAFGNRLVAGLGAPVGLLDYAVNGSGLLEQADWGTGFWLDRSPNGIFHQFLKGIAAVGGAVEYVVWMQGEADAARATITRSQYREGLEELISDRIRASIVNGSHLPGLPVLIIGMPKRPVGNDIAHQAIRNAQIDAAEEIPECYLAATTMDLSNLGRQHLTPAAYTTLGLRTAQTILFLAGAEKYYRGPQVIAMIRSAEDQVDIAIAHRGGNDYSPPDRISGWQVISENEPLRIENVFRLNAQTIRIQLADAASGPLNVRYLYGAMPDARRAVRDNSAVALPLEPVEAIVE